MVQYNACNVDNEVIWPSECRWQGVMYAAIVDCEVDWLLEPGC